MPIRANTTFKTCFFIIKKIEASRIPPDKIMLYIGWRFIASAALAAAWYCSSVMIVLLALSCKNFAIASLPTFVRLLTIGSIATSSLKLLVQEIEHEPQYQAPLQ